MARLFEQIDTIIIRVSDWEQSRDWYCEKLGLEMIYIDESIRLAVLDTGNGSSITLWQTDQQIKNNPATMTYPIFKTNNAEDAREKLKNAGVKTGMLITNTITTYFQFFDPDGNVLEACQVHG